MNIIYHELLGNRKYCVLESETDSRKSYSISIDDTVVNDFTSIKENAVEFLELLISNAVSPLHLYEISVDYLANC